MLYNSFVWGKGWNWKTTIIKNLGILTFENGNESAEEIFAEYRPIHTKKDNYNDTITSPHHNYNKKRNNIVRIAFNCLSTDKNIESQSESILL